MSDQVTSFESSLEADIEKLAAEIQGQREKPEMQNANERELVKEAIRSFPVLEKKPGGTVSAAAPSAAGAASSKSPLPDYAQSAPAEVKLEIEYLMDVALKQGLSKALSEAHASPYFVQDALHDALAGRLYPELQKRGVVK
jgi:hypothetical protein